jgi:hypothetical protein
VLKREGPFVYTKEETRLPPLNTGVWRLLDEQIVITRPNAASLFGSFSLPSQAPFFGGEIVSFKTREGIGFAVYIQYSVYLPVRD